MTMTMNQFRKHFTVAEANKTLPLVRAIVTDVVAQLQRVEELRQRLTGASSADRASSNSNSKSEKGQAPRSKKSDFYSEEVAQTEAQLESEIAKLRSFIRELHDLGVEFKGADGLCDFPSLHDGREVYLCWKLGEPEVMHWHEIDEGFNGRQRLADEHSSSGGDRDLRKVKA